MNEDISEIERKISETAARWNMFPRGCTAVVGFSGGADSVTLTHFLWKHAETLGIRLVAAHVNHGLRGAEADFDETFVKAWCAERKIELKILHADVRLLARERSMGLEECGREVRYSFFSGLCGETGRIVTAHTLSDSTETVLMNFAKGAGPRGLSGIPPVRGGIVRPLIGITRAEVERYCLFNRLSYVTDSTNLTDEYERNRIRHTVVPALREINPRLEEAAGRSIELMRCDEEYFSAEAEKLLRAAETPEGYLLTVLRRAPRPVLLRAIVSAAENTCASRLGYSHILAAEELILAGKGSVTVAGGIQCETDGNTFYVSRPDEAPCRNWKVRVEGEETLLPDGRVLCIRKAPEIESKFENKINNLLFNNLINYDTILSTESYARNRQDGDCFRPAGRGVTKSLKKLFNEAHVPPRRRSSLLILESSGSILWVEGFGPSETARVTEQTGCIAEIQIKGK